VKGAKKATVGQCSCHWCQLCCALFSSSQVCVAGWNGEHSAQCHGRSRFTSYWNWWQNSRARLCATNAS